MKTNAYRDLFISQQIHNKYGSRVEVKESIIEMPKIYFVWLVINLDECINW